ncbi:MAG: hypothetical protein L0177_16675 [Chloroflexi bacterium]|nr:hypothetical protein [Chloroflexota bacterium]
MRTFPSGATRNTEVDADYHGFLSPLALHAYGEYMHRHRLQADGTMRDSDNWQKGIPNDAFVRSLVRHVHDVQLIHDGYEERARHDGRDDNALLSHLSAALFNVQGLLHNYMLAELKAEREEVTPCLLSSSAKTSPAESGTELSAPHSSERPQPKRSRNSLAYDGVQLQLGF